MIGMKQTPVPVPEARRLSALGLTPRANTRMQVPQLPLKELSAVVASQVPVPSSCTGIPCIPTATVATPRNSERYSERYSERSMPSVEAWPAAMLSGRLVQTEFPANQDFDVAMATVAATVVAASPLKVQRPQEVPVIMGTPKSVNSVRKQPQEVPVIVSTPKSVNSARNCAPNVNSARNCAPNRGPHSVMPQTSLASVTPTVSSHEHNRLTRSGSNKVISAIPVSHTPGSRSSLSEPEAEAEAGKSKTRSVEAELRAEMAALCEILLKKDAQIVQKDAQIESLRTEVHELRRTLDREGEERAREREEYVREILALRRGCNADKENQGSCNLEMAKAVGREARRMRAVKENWPAPNWYQGTPA